ncbi:dihydropteroate synthase [Brevundimonas sp.]|uniref:dihydropteroate synthase n=1 Tax=Brevundimonas sp. TaxID=1871086 RepID=UPI002FC92689
MKLKTLLSSRDNRLPLVMGVLNVTPDSFSDGGCHDDAAAALSHARRLIADGADVLDIGGESTRPGSDPVSAEEEIARVVPVIEALAREWDGVISIDTMKPQVARAAIKAGAHVWNDVSALRYAPDSVETAAELGCELILMHMRGDPKTMQDAPHYTDVVAEVCRHLSDQAEAAMVAGVGRDNIWLDPGIGFAKNLAHNLALTAKLRTLCDLGYPVLYAASRKRMIGEIDPAASDARDRLGGTIALHLEGARQGAAMVRVHDVREMVQALKVQAAIDEAAQ